MKNYQLLGLTVDPGSDFVIKLDELGQENQRYVGVPLDTYRQGHIRTVMTYPCWEQLEIVTVPNLNSILEEGLALVTDYFHGDWWTAESIRRVEKQTPELLPISEWLDLEGIIRSNARSMDRSNPDCNFRWREELRSGIIFGGMLEKWDEVAHICSALDADVKLEYSAGTIVDEYFQYYLCVAGNLSGQWTDGMEALLESAKKCRQRRLRQTIAAWEAAIAGEQPAFDKAFTAAVKSLVKREDDPSEYLGIGLDETVIWLIAEKHGLSFPALPDKLKAAVMTRESLGLDTPA